MKRIKNSLLLFSIFLFPTLVFAKNYKGAEYRTIESFLYGRFEVRYKASPGSGQTSTFFTYNDINPNEQWNEIDIEILGRYADDVQFNTITPRQGNNHVRHQFVRFDPSLDFHTYTIEWTPDYVAWFIDSVEVYRQTDEHIATLIRPQKIMMNIWNPSYENWVGSWFDQSLPQFAYYDYVSYASYAPDSGNVGTNNKFKLEWFDDFDSWDQTRWQKATHTFGGNNCDFVPENIVFQDGLMILCLTDNTNLGYVDKIAPYVLWARANKTKVTVKFSESVDPTSAGNISNYAIPGIIVNSLTLLPDKSTVVFLVSDLDSTQNYNLIVSGIMDDLPGQNRLMGQMVNIIMAQPLNFPAKINVGGRAVSDFLPDQNWSERVEYGYQDGYTNELPEGETVTGTDIAEIYQTQRIETAKFKARVPNGIYKVTLMMAEHQFNRAGIRVFDIYVEDNLVAKNFDLYKLAKKQAAFDIILNKIEVNDEILDIHFAAVKDKPLLNGLIIEQISTKVGELNNNLKQTFSLIQNYPNPFNSSTVIRYQLEQSGFVKLNIYDIQGRNVKTLVDDFKEKGFYSENFEATGLASGLYFSRLQVGDFKKTIKLTLMK